jgi:hypothetical protein
MATSSRRQRAVPASSSPNLGYRCLLRAGSALAWLGSPDGLPFPGGQEERHPPAGRPPAQLRAQRLLPGSDGCRRALERLGLPDVPSPSCAHSGRELAEQPGGRFWQVCGRPRQRRYHSLAALLGVQDDADRNAAASVGDGEVALGPPRVRRLGADPPRTRAVMVAGGVLLVVTGLLETTGEGNGSSSGCGCCSRPRRLPRCERHRPVSCSASSAAGACIGPPPRTARPRQPAWTAGRRSDDPDYRAPSGSSGGLGSGGKLVGEPLARGLPGYS